MRKLSAYYVFPIVSVPLPFGIIETEDNGTIIRIVDTGGDLKELSKLEYYQGILLPGIVMDAIDLTIPEEICQYIFDMQKNSPGMTLNEIIRTLTLDGARKICLENRLGSLEAGKKPGIQFIDNVDLENMKITAESKLWDLIPVQ
jgi:hypothetical protein